ncbi:hypothetical protein, conserved [Entamoeba dispar SAW760]|uniref:Tyrosine-protein kinase ephrin type A/B receptor-like domain-containing protein n=1 Tax=Entamoeba dispar (strain ATCC PRA-260 / SAW760) TaxID=370354 RepID=B0ECV5_ENTDS|nr:uncharacterized protein EDI_278180 [Entamoeba dispar SAW760]EDR27647.1 hypothetical protein, conserved [Entamoeba dispar SAW760]|eukprot:EDR27647.1 hypothetical protein, conserved [Entamoeba dispar SAW760]
MGQFVNIINVLIFVCVSSQIIKEVKEECFDNEYFDESQSKCISCPAGKQPNQNKDQCVNCTAGYYSTENSPCLQCMPGTYSGIGSAKCHQCPDGYYTDKYGQYECIKCDPPFISDKHHSSCEICPEGTIYVGYDKKVLPCQFCGMNAISTDNGTKCQECDENQAPYNNVCYPFCDDIIQHQCLVSNCSENQYYNAGECESCLDGHYCKHGILYDCSELDNSCCRNNEITHCTPFIQNPNSNYSECELSLPFISVLIVSVTFICAFVVIFIVFVITKLVVQKKAIDFSQNNAQETDPTKVYLLSF